MTRLICQGLAVLSVAGALFLLAATLDVTNGVDDVVLGLAYLTGMAGFVVLAIGFMKHPATD